MESLKIYEIQFEAMFPVPNGLLILAKSNKEAMEIAAKTLSHTKPINATCIKQDKSKVIFFESGNY